MRTVFIVNPNAGKGSNIQKFVDEIKQTADRLNVDVQVYLTKAVGDAEVFVRRYCIDFGPARFVACGGDGTLNEVVNGAYGFDDVEIGVVPMGTGNDFRRNFKDCGEFTDIEAQIKGICEKCDVIRYSTQLENGKKVGCGVNMFNIGFDCNVADLTARMKKKPFISGSFAYFISIFGMLIKKKGANIAIELDGDVVHMGPLLLTSIANGCYCGGGIMSNPLAEIQDGLINVNIVNNVSRRRFIGLLPHYMKGDFLDLEDIDEVVVSPKCRNVVVTPLEGTMKMSIDGEICQVGRTEFEVLHNAVNFVVPAKKLTEDAQRDKEHTFA